MVMNRQALTTGIEVIGGCLIVIGVSAVSIPLALIVAGIGLIALGGLIA
jgi:hypothetical protein